MSLILDNLTRQINNSPDKYTMQPVFPRVGDTGVPFIYTVGLHAQLGYEVMFLGSASKGSAMIIASLVEGELLRGKPLFTGNNTDLANVPIRAVMHEAGECSNYVVQAEQYAKSLVKVVQLIPADRNGLFADQEGSDPIWNAKQKL